MSATSIQVGGTHYTECAIQPVQFIEANKLAFLEGCVVKRMCRHDKATGKGRLDIEKAIHELQLLLEHRYPEPSPANDNQPARTAAVSASFSDTAPSGPAGLLQPVEENPSSATTGA